jgi:hypothetical protein
MACPEGAQRVERAGLGSVHAFFLYDVAEAIDLGRVQTLVGSTVPAKLAPRATTPPYVQYQQPPISIEGHSVGMSDLDGFQVRFKAFDYGVISVALTRPLPDTWDLLLQQGLSWYDNPALSAGAERFCRALVARLDRAVTRPRPDFLTEDYLVFTSSPRGGAPADAMIATHGAELAQLLRGEKERLSAQEVDEVLRHRISYFENDVVIPTWNAAFVYDEEAGAQGALEILEFANSQLLEFRYYDRLLDAELARIYAQLQRSGWRHTWFGRRYARAARQIQGVFIDVNELTDRTENALKIAGDVYAARLFALAAARLGLDHWKASVREKLQTINDIYKFAVEHTAMARGEFLELTIVLLIVLEIVLALTRP